MRNRIVTIFIIMIIKFKKISEEEILNRYIIKNKNKYINERYVLVDDKQKAIKFNDEKRAQKFLKCNLKKSDKEEYIIEEINVLKPKNKNSSQQNSDYNYMVDSIETIADKHYELYNKDNLLEHSLDDILNLFSTLPNKLINEKSKTNSQLIKCCRILTDIMHYRELFPRRSASERCKLDVFETNTLLKRRELKDNLLKIEAIEENLKGNKKGVNLDDRKYKPRILNDLFENKVIPNFDEWWDEHEQNGLM